MKRLFTSLFICTIALHAMDLSAHAAGLKGYSGMTRITGDPGNDTYLVVSDVKGEPEESRLYTLRVQVLGGRSPGFIVKPLEVEGLEELPNDLEAICSIPGTDQYLMTESGYYKGTGGRIYVISVTPFSGVWKAELVKVMTHKGLLGNMLDGFKGVSSAGSTDLELRTKKVTTFAGSQIEGLSCISAGGKVFLVLGLRGNTEKGQDRRKSKIIWGELNLSTFALSHARKAYLLKKTVLGDRDCSDLYIKLEADGNSWAVWSVATSDSSDVGSFSSVVYEAGVFSLGDAGDSLVYVPRETARLPRHIRGFKVEALAAPHQSIEGSQFAIGTDDEDYPGVWRPLN